MPNADFETQWLHHYAKRVSEEDMQKYVISTGNLIWHIFSWKLLPEGTYLVGDAARAAYDVQNKTDAIFHLKYGGRGKPPTAQTITTAASVERYPEIYIAAPDFSWTYIKTHEGDLCGPYFCKKEDIIKTIPYTKHKRSNHL